VGEIWGDWRGGGASSNIRRATRLFPKLYQIGNVLVGRNRKELDLGPTNRNQFVVKLNVAMGKRKTSCTLPRGAVSNGMRK